SILAFAASASAHMVMEYPKPYGHPNNSPLDNSGADFPCKATGPESYSVTEMNVWNAGESREVEFKGGATHGGGSCQFSLTPGTAPTKESQWKVIHTVHGGCPANTKGNLSGSPDNKDGLAKIAVTLPSDLPPGEYTFAWTWFNKVGNREMYMNCAPIQVGGGGGKVGTADVSAVLGSLPDMFVANIPREQCHTSESVDFQFPDPGQSVEQAPNAELGSQLTGPGCAAMTKLGAGNGQLGTPSQPTGSPAPPAESKAPTVTAAPSPTANNPGGIFAPGASSALPTEKPAPTAVPPPPAPSSSPAPPALSPPANNTPPASGDAVPCNTDGAIVCIGNNQFGLCNFGFAIPQSLAAGTVCSNGVISAAAQRRSIRFP
ncbi:uncharacterized protein EI97DRAFT_357446, partial [Westerdykella ornata]